MIKLNELQQEILKSDLSSFEKAEINKLLPSFGQSFLEFVYKETQKLHFELIGDALFDLLNILDVAQKNIFNSDFSQAVEILEQAAYNNRWENGLYILPWALDLKDLAKSKKFSPSQDFLNALYRFQIMMFDSLPKEDVIEIMAQYLLFAISNCELLMELKFYTYKNHLDDNKDFLPNVLRAIQNNGELLGDTNILVDEKVVPPQIKNWLKDYLFFARKGGTGVNTFEEVQYSKVSKNFLALDSQQKNTLLLIFKLYSWVTKPVIIKQQMDDFKIEKEKKIENGAGLVSEKYALPSELFRDSQIIEPPVVPVPGRRVVQREMGEISRISNDKLQIPNVSPPPSLPPAGGGIKQNEKTADGSAIDSLTAKNDFRGQTGAESSVPVTSTQNQSSDSGSGRATLQEKIYQGNNNEASGNKKAAPFGAALGFQQVPESLALTSENS